MRQVLLVTRPKDGSPSSPVVLWMDDTARVGDGLKWRGDQWVVSAVYGTHFSASARVARRDRPYRPWEKEVDSGDPSLDGLP